MRKSEALKMIDDHKNKLINPVEMLNWTWLRLIILCMTDQEWERCVTEAAKIASR